ncbi:class I SAM-dependent methyltransferase [Nonomuraea angiospora]|uniref:Phospholipid N-methyltransferase n=1 Tax=Nonomuraea angiospora TaxID=46172 RepID=A0ABR9M614_9ACTN|nr:methyltransferase domain-containing protein [Nonomuraea angiospora]MBE1588347.1 phospholipid N-methyltransferase [Nonomuraea angiospora]
MRSDLGVFLKAAVSRPLVIGAFAPTSEPLAAQLVEVVPKRGAPTVLELGPGTGAISELIRSRLPAQARFVAVETDRAMVDHLAETRPWLEVLHMDAADLGSRIGEGEVDAVVSALPWTLIPERAQGRILEAISRVLASGGSFTTIAYLTGTRFGPGRRFRGRLGAAFDEVLTTRTVWRNLPPARTYVCRRPIAATQQRGSRSGSP